MKTGIVTGMASGVWTCDQRDPLQKRASTRDQVRSSETEKSCSL